jgi:hypothetical protein
MATTLDAQREHVVTVSQFLILHVNLNQCLENMGEG